MPVGEPRPPAPGAFELICEVEPPTRPDLRHVRHQIGVLSKVADGFLIPDNHIGRATVSSIAVAHEVELMGGRSIACLNSRDRNLLGLRRDLLTAAAYGVDQFLFVAGDRPTSGERTGQLTVASMIAETREFESTAKMRVGVTSTLRPLPEWKRTADFLFAQVSFDVDALCAWRASVDFDGPVYAGVMVVASAAMAARLAVSTPQLQIPQLVVDALAASPDAGVELACRLVDEIRDSGQFAGVHLIGVSKYRQLAARLESGGP
jgi:5,10-methylenetetrahydrofolate reductase